MGFTLLLPWPPSVNRMWRTISKGKLAGRTLLSEQGRDYRRDVGFNVARQAPRRPFPMAGRLSVSIVARPPDRRRRDLDNVLKGPLDALQHAGLYLDDEQIDEIRIVRGGILSPCGELSITISEVSC